ncbi:MAG: hypothetical protein MI757_10360 [Pirellulales bacterium]|nr:hypothetical protein [Pirellulales bacterium]
MADEREHPPDSLAQALIQLATSFAEKSIPYALIGGLGAGYRSRPRFTQDIDIVLSVSQVALPGLLDDLKSRGFKCDAETAIREWTREHMTTLSFGPVRIDWLKPVLPLYQAVIDSAREECWLGIDIRVASAEGLILTKLAAFRRQDQVDIENLLAANRGDLELEFVRRQWLAIAEPDDERTVQFEEMVRSFYDRES